MHLKDPKDETQRFNSIFDGLKKIYKSEGISGLYKGIESKLVQSVLTAAFTFAFKEQFFSLAVWFLTFTRIRAAKIAAN
jgi:adenine nucleotide transporter 17